MPKFGTSDPLTGAVLLAQLEAAGLITDLVAGVLAAPLLAALESDGLITDIAAAVLLPSVHKVLTFDGTAGKGAIGSNKLFTVTGAIKIEGLFLRKIVDLGNGGNGGDNLTIRSGVAGGMATGATVTTFNSIAGNAWFAPSLGVDDAVGENVMPSAQSWIVSDDIELLVNAHAIVSGQVEAILFYRPSPGGGSAVAA